MNNHFLITLVNTIFAWEKNIYARIIIMYFSLLNLNLKYIFSLLRIIFLQFWFKSSKNANFMVFFYLLTKQINQILSFFIFFVDILKTSKIYLVHLCLHVSLCWISWKLINNEKVRFNEEKYARIIE